MLKNYIQFIVHRIKPNQKIWQLMAMHSYSNIILIGVR